MFVLNLLLICVIFKSVCPQECNTMEDLGNINITENGRVVVCVLNENNRLRTRRACSNNWDRKESLVACRSSDYPGVVSDGGQTNNTNLGIIFTCEGTELNLSKCNYSTTQEMCFRLRRLECQLCSDYPCPNTGVCNSDNKCDCIKACQNGGYCQAGICICPSGYDGDSCELCPKCQNGGTCLSNGTCECSSPFYGDYCENEPCDPPCKNNGTCINGVCECIYPFNGTSCQYCPLCQNGGTCISFETPCNCTPGYTGENCGKVSLTKALPPIFYAAPAVVIIIVLVLASIVMFLLILFLSRYLKNKADSALPHAQNPQETYCNIKQRPRSLNCQTSVDPKVESDSCIYEEIQQSLNSTPNPYCVSNTPMNNPFFSGSVDSPNAAPLSNCAILESNLHDNPLYGELGITSCTNNDLYQTYMEASQYPYTGSSMIVPRSDMKPLTNEVVYPSLDTTFSNPSAVENETTSTYFNQEDDYWEPPKNLDLLFNQMSEKRFREIDRSAVELQDQIGSGQFGHVYKAIWHTSGDQSNPFTEKGTLPVAVKTLHNQSTTELKTAFIQEAAIMGQFSHPNVLCLLGIVSRTEPFMIVTELMHMELLELLLTIRNSSIQRSQVLSLLLEFSRQIASGMTYLSSKNFIHRDLAARNVLVANDLTCRISDFGMSRQLREEGDYYTSKGGGKVPLKWTSPEAIFFQRYSEKSDVWSFGMTLYEIWTLGEKPWSNYSNDQVLGAFSNSEVMDQPKECPAGIWSVMLQCWEPTQELRPTFEQTSGLLSVSDSTLLDELPPIEKYLSSLS